MPSKIEMSYGSVTFSGEGEEQWLAAQLDKILKAMQTVPPAQNKSNVAAAVAPGNFTTTLASYLRSKNATSAQVSKFLATADWLRQKGTTPITTASVSRALVDAQQTKLNNPADCLNQNVSKGFCEKTENGFYITPEGLAELGHKQ